MNIFWLLQVGGPFFGMWQIVVDIFWIVVGGGGWWWVVVGGGIAQPNSFLNSFNCYKQSYFGQNLVDLSKNTFYTKFERFSKPDLKLTEKIV